MASRLTKVGRDQSVVGVISVADSNALVTVDDDLGKYLLPSGLCDEKGNLLAWQDIEDRHPISRVALERVLGSGVVTLPSGIVESNPKMTFLTNSGVIHGQWSNLHSKLIIQTNTVAANVSGIFAVIHDSSDRRVSPVASIPASRYPTVDNSVIVFDLPVFLNRNETYHYHVYASGAPVQAIGSGIPNYAQAYKPPAGITGRAAGIHLGSEYPFDPTDDWYNASGSVEGFPGGLIAIDGENIGLHASPDSTTTYTSLFYGWFSNPWIKGSFYTLNTQSGTVIKRYTDATKTTELGSITLSVSGGGYYKFCRYIPLIDKILFISTYIGTSIALLLVEPDLSAQGVQITIPTNSIASYLGQAIAVDQTTIFATGWELSEGDPYATSMSVIDVGENGLDLSLRYAMSMADLSAVWGTGTLVAMNNYGEYWDWANVIPADGMNLAGKTASIRWAKPQDYDNASAFVAAANSASGTLSWSSATMPPLYSSFSSAGFFWLKDFQFLWNTTSAGVSAFKSGIDGAMVGSVADDAPWYSNSSSILQVSAPKITRSGNNLTLTSESVSYSGLTLLKASSQLYTAMERSFPMAYHGYADQVLFAHYNISGTARVLTLSTYDAFTGVRKQGPTQVCSVSSAWTPSLSCAGEAIDLFLSHEDDGSGFIHGWLADTSNGYTVGDWESTGTPPGYFRMDQERHYMTPADLSTDEKWNSWICQNFLGVDLRSGRVKCNDLTTHDHLMTAFLAQYPGRDIPVLGVTAVGGGNTCQSMQDVLNAIDEGSQEDLPLSANGSDAAMDTIDQISHDGVGRYYEFPRRMILTTNQNSGSRYRTRPTVPGLFACQLTGYQEAIHPYMITAIDSVRNRTLVAYKEYNTDEPTITRGDATLFGANVQYILDMDTAIDFGGTLAVMREYSAGVNEVAVYTFTNGVPSYQGLAFSSSDNLSTGYRTGGGSFKLRVSNNNIGNPFAVLVDRSGSNYNVAIRTAGSTTRLWSAGRYITGVRITNWFDFTDDGNYAACLVYYGDGGVEIYLSTKYTTSAPSSWTSAGKVQLGVTFDGTVSELSGALWNVGFTNHSPSEPSYMAFTGVDTMTGIPCLIIMNPTTLTWSKTLLPDAKDCRELGIGTLTGNAQSSGVISGEVLIPVYIITKAGICRRVVYRYYSSSSRIEREESGSAGPLTGGPVMGLALPTKAFRDFAMIEYGDEFRDGTVYCHPIQYPSFGRTIGAIPTSVLSLSWPEETSTHGRSERVAFSSTGHEYTAWPGWPVWGSGRAQYPSNERALRLGVGTVMSVADIQMGACYNILSDPVWTITSLTDYD